MDVDDTEIHFTYQGKGGMDLDRTLANEKIASVIDHCAEIPGQRLFVYQDHRQEYHIDLPI